MVEVGLGCGGIGLSWIGIVVRLDDSDDSDGDIDDEVVSLIWEIDGNSGHIYKFSFLSS